MIWLLLIREKNDRKVIYHRRSLRFASLPIHTRMLFEQMIIKDCNYTHLQGFIKVGHIEYEYLVG